MDSNFFKSALKFMVIFLAAICLMPASVFSSDADLENFFVSAAPVFAPMEDKTMNVPVKSSSSYDIDFTQYNYNMASALIFDMFVSPEKYAGKRVHIKGKFYTEVNQYGRFYSVIITDLTACCQTGIDFEDASRKYPGDYPALMEDIDVSGVFSIRMIDGNAVGYIDCGS